MLHESRKENGAGNEIRTRDPNLGKVVLYQLSYSRLSLLRLNERVASPRGVFTAARLTPSGLSSLAKTFRSASFAGDRSNPTNEGSTLGLQSTRCQFADRYRTRFSGVP